MVGAILQLYVTCLLDKGIAADGDVTAMSINFNLEVFDVKEMSTSDVFCLSLYSGAIKCTDQGVQLMYGYCATYNATNDSYIIKCPYFELGGHNVTEPGFIRLPDNITELNDYMCAPMNRKGLLCKDCIDGFGPSVTSLRYKYSNCTDAWYGIQLYLAVELIPITLFYLVILIFKIHLISAPMVLFIIYHQLIMYKLIFLGRIGRRILLSQGIYSNGPLLKCFMAFGALILSISLCHHSVSVASFSLCILNSLGAYLLFIYSF